MSRLVLVGPLPPPYYGQSVSFRMLVDEIERMGVPHSVVDLAHGEISAEKIGVVTRHRMAEYAGILRRYAAEVAGRRGTVYITIAQSRPGFLRDCVMIRLAALFGHRIVVHLKGGNYGNFYAAQPAWLRSLIRSTLRRADRVLVLGRAAAQHVRLRARAGPAHPRGPQRPPRRPRAAAGRQDAPRAGPGARPHPLPFQPGGEQGVSVTTFGARNRARRAAPLPNQILRSALLLPRE